MRPEQHAKMAAEMKQRLKVEELEENIDELEDVVEDVFPILILTVFVAVLLLIIFLIRLYLRWFAPNPSKNRMDGKTVLITGGTSGIGKCTAIELAKRNARVLIAGREKAKVEAVARNIRKKTGNQHVNALVLDLGNLRSIQEFAEDFRKDEKYLHVLINNAAYMGPLSKTDDGLERSFGVNYLGHFYLTYLLSDKLKKNAPSRIINVVSDSYKQGELDLDDLAMNKGYSVYSAYTRSKLAQVMFNLECHKRYIGNCVWSFAAHPGPTATDLLRNYPGMWGNALRLVSRIMFKPPEDGCQTLVYLAVADGLREFSGKLFTDCKAVKTNEKVKANKELSSRLWNVSAHLCGFEGDALMPEDEPEATPNAEEAGEATAEEEKKSQ
ncbi:retinol dehydrogenase 12 [Aplysia californica]|uniref:Retinol dehydrogenase 12 n=1 Tax=Aplysia californica TaxID=6500 RepID=A0ABM1A9C0_APLCA|nr:retinol dehydrogenase 12 [Aplysia californica]